MQGVAHTSTVTSTASVAPASASVSLAAPSVALPSPPVRPQLSVAVVSGVAGVERDSLWSDSRWHNALRAELSLSKRRYSDLGVGPLVEVSTLSFEDVSGSFGGFVQVPFAWVVVAPSIAGVAHVGPRGTSVGLDVALFAGVQGFDFERWYTMRNGLQLGYRRLWGDDATGVLSFSVVVDLAVFALPAAWLWGARRMHSATLTSRGF